MNLAEQMRELRGAAERRGAAVEIWTLAVVKIKEAAAAGKSGVLQHVGALRGPATTEVAEQLLQIARDEGFSAELTDPGRCPGTNVEIRW